MNTGLIWFLCLVIPVTYLSYRIIPGYLNYRHNPIWRAAQLRMLSVGQVKRNILTPYAYDIARNAFRTISGTETLGPDV